MVEKKSNSQQKNMPVKATTETLLTESAKAPQKPTEKIIRVISGVDKPFMILVMVLVGFGIIAVASASYSYAEMTQGDSYYFTKKHIAFAVVGVICMLGLSYFDYRFLKKLAIPVWVVSILLCLAVWTPLGHSSGGARRWLNLGLFTFQPSEVLKFGVILMCARYAANAKEKIKRKRSIIYYALIVVVSIGALVIQPHLSGSIIIFGLVFCMIIMSGVRISVILPLVGVGIAGATVALTKFAHAMARLSVWYDPFDPLYFKNDGWQPAQSLFAIASGGLLGVGLGQSNQKDGYIPEPQNDYIFSIICEEMGFIGAVGVILVFAALIWRGMYIAKRAPTVFSSLLVAGIVCQIAIQAVLNIAVVTNTLPSTGISLPFLSSGGTSLTILLAQMGFVLSASRHSIVEQG